MTWSGHQASLSQHLSQLGRLRPDLGHLEASQVRLSVTVTLDVVLSHLGVFTILWSSRALVWLDSPYAHSRLGGIFLMEPSPDDDNLQQSSVLWDMRAVSDKVILFAEVALDVLG